VADPAGSCSLSGHLVYRRAAELYATPFDLKQLAVTGVEAPISEGVEGTVARPFAFAPTGVGVYTAAAATAAGVFTLVWMDRKGAAQPLAAPAHPWRSLSVSPDGTRIAIESVNVASTDVLSTELWAYDLERGSLTHLTSDTRTPPVWTPDGRWLTYGALHGGRFGIYRLRADGGGAPELLLETEQPAAPSSWTTDGKTLLYEQMDGGKMHAWNLTPGDGKPRRLFPARTLDESLPQVSPDGKWLAYESTESGKPEVYLAPASGDGGRITVSTSGGRVPKWSHNGRELFYVEVGGSAQPQLMAVDVQTGPPFRMGAPHPLFRLQVAGQTWAPAPDGQRFLVTGRPPTQESEQRATFVIVTDWFSELSRRAPVKK
jgi:serine/threonine-protein kinase